MAPPAGAALVLMLLILIRLHGDAQPRPHGNSCSPPGHLTQEALSLLRALGSSFPSSCHFFNNNVTLPGNISTNQQQCQPALRLVHEALRGAGNVFEEQEPYLGGVLWDDRKLDDFQNILYQLLEYPCFSQLDSSGLLDPYFSNITALIQNQDVCGWYVLRRDLVWILRTVLRKQHHCFSWPRLQNQSRNRVWTRL